MNVRPRLTLKTKTPPLALEAFKAKIGLARPTPPADQVARPIDPAFAPPVDPLLRNAPLRSETTLSARQDARPHLAHDKAIGSAAATNPKDAPRCPRPGPLGSATGPGPARSSSPPIDNIGSPQDNAAGNNPNPSVPKRARKPPPPHSTLLWPSRAKMRAAVQIPGEAIDPSATFGAQTKLDARFWTRRCAAELAAAFPDQKEAAELFALQHGLSVQNAFYRRLRRSDVLEWLVDEFSKTMKAQELPVFEVASFTGGREGSDGGRRQLSGAPKTPLRRGE